MPQGSDGGGAASSSGDRGGAGSAGGRWGESGAERTDAALGFRPVAPAVDGLFRSLVLCRGVDEAGEIASVGFYARAYGDFASMRGAAVALEGDERAAELWDRLIVAGDDSDEAEEAAKRLAGLNARWTVLLASPRPPHATWAGWGGAAAVWMPHALLTGRMVQDGAARNGKKKAVLVLPEQRIHRARLVLRELFAPIGDKRDGFWNLVRHAGDWWQYVPCLHRYVAVSNERIGATIGERLEVAGYKAARRTRTVICEHCEEKEEDCRCAENGKEFSPTTKQYFQPWQASDKGIREILMGAIAYTAAPGEAMPMWLPRAFDRQGQAQWEVLSDPGLSEEEDEGLPPRDDVASFDNGILDIGAAVEGRLEAIMRPHTSRWFSNVSVPYDFPEQEFRELARDFHAAATPGQEKDADALIQAAIAEMCPAATAFLNHVSGGSHVWQETFWSFLGLCMTPDISMERNVLWLKGHEGVGKGTITEGFLPALVGDENIAATTLDAITQPIGGVSDLVGKNVVVISELEVTGNTNIGAAMAIWKAATVGDKVRVRDVYKPAQHIRMSAKWIMTMNSTPKLHDTGGVPRRIVPLPMGAPPKKPDTTLKQRLRTEERKGICLGATFGLLKLRRRVRRGEPAFVMTDQMREIVDEIRRTSSVVMGFIEDECVVGPGNGCESQLLYAAFKDWCEGHGVGPMAANAFGAKLKDGFAITSSKERRGDAPGKFARIYWGVRVRTARDDEEEGQLRAYVQRGRRSDGTIFQHWGESLLPT